MRKVRNFKTPCRLPGLATCGRAYTTITGIFFGCNVCLSDNSTGFLSVIRLSLFGGSLTKVGLRNSHFFCIGPLRTSKIEHFGRKGNKHTG